MLKIEIKLTCSYIFHMGFSLLSPANFWPIQNNDSLEQLQKSIPQRQCTTVQLRTTSEDQKIEEVTKNQNQPLAQGAGIFNYSNT
jgi:hypothetical protein